MMNSQSLILELVDQQTGCFFDKIAFDSEQSLNILSLLDLGEATFDCVAYHLDANDLELLRMSYPAKGIAQDIQEAFLRERNASDDLPYTLHTNRELLMMLAGTKPLAVFSDVHPWTSPELILLCDKFAPYVESGRFVQKEFFETLKHGDQTIQIKLVLFALPDEQWRIPAYMLLRTTSRFSGWNDALERMEGSLLGYSDDENSIHLSC